MQVFEYRMGAPRHIAEAATNVRVDASLRGIDSHGISVLPYYVERWEQGQIVPDAEPETVHETLTTTVLDARKGLGHYASGMAVEYAARKARATGMGSAVVRNSTHNGAIGYYALQIAHQRMIGIAATACAPNVAPHGGTEGLHGTNPFAYALPRKEGDPLIFDFATGYSGAKLKKLAERDGCLPEGAVIDAQGRPTTDPSDIKSGWILPVSGNIGYGLGLLVDALTGALADAPVGRQLPLVTDTSRPYDGACHVLAISPEAFGGWDGFSSRIDFLVDQIAKNPPQDPNQPVRWPGQRGWRERDQRRVAGIPIDEREWERLQSLAPVGK